MKTKTADRFQIQLQAVRGTRKVWDTVIGPRKGYATEAEAGEAVKALMAFKFTHVPTGGAQYMKVRIVRTSDPAAL